MYHQCVRFCFVGAVSSPVASVELTCSTGMALERRSQDF